MARLKSGAAPSQTYAAAQYDASMPCNTASRTDVTPTTREKKVKRRCTCQGDSMIEPRPFAMLMPISARPAACVTTDNAISDMPHIQSSLQPPVAPAGSIDASRVLNSCVPHGSAMGGRCLGQVVLSGKSPVDLNGYAMRL